ncbi:hypothetical protein PILCRDRAFT_61176, partial [Piloderma croceum F 1598]
LSLFTADLIQAAGMAMDARWVHIGKVQTGTFCTVQGALHQLGETGVAWSTLVIAIHTFIVVWCRNDSIRRNLTLACILLGIIWLFILLFVVVGITVHTGGGNFYETPTPYWCWIGERYTAERIFGQYLWLWLTLLVSILSYIPLFFWARGYITVDSQRWWKFTLHYKIPFDALDHQSRQRTLGMIAYPFVYSILVLPLSIVRWTDFAQGSKEPSVATFIVINIYALSGAFNALLLLWTRPNFFIFKDTSMGQAPMAKWNIPGSSTDISLHTGSSVGRPNNAG